MNIRKIALTATALLGLLAASQAHAGPDVQWQVSIETPKIRLPGHVVLPLPPVPVPRAVVVAPARDDRCDDRGWRESRRWDLDGDGIPNRYDPYPYDPRNGRGWHHRHHEDRRDWREDRRDWREDRREWREDRRDWRDDRRDGRHH